MNSSSFFLFFSRVSRPPKDVGRKGRQNKQKVPKYPKYSMNERCQQLLIIAMNCKWECLTIAINCNCMSDNCNCQQLLTSLVSNCNQLQLRMTFTMAIDCNCDQMTSAAMQLRMSAWKFHTQWLPKKKSQYECVIWQNFMRSWSTLNFVELTQMTQRHFMPLHIRPKRSTYVFVN